MSGFWHTPFMAMQQNPAVLETLSKFDSRVDAFECNDLEGALQSLVESKSWPDEERKGLWAEAAAFSFFVQDGESGPPWNSYFRPYMSGKRKDGTPFARPDIADANSETVTYWRKRAKEAKHPTMIARYADLVWDFAAIVAKTARPKTDIEFARLAIDSYLAASRIDSGEAWGDTHMNLTRSLKLALQIRDSVRVQAVVAETLRYVERTAKDGEIGTFCYLFDNLLPASKGPAIDSSQEEAIVNMFDQRFEAMSKPGSGWDANPTATRQVGERLVGYYERKGQPDKARDILLSIAKQHERRAGLGSAIAGMHFLELARLMFLRAGAKEEAERIQVNSQSVGKAAESEMVTTRIKQEVPQEEIDTFKAGLIADGLANGLLFWANAFIPRQSDLDEEDKRTAEAAPLFSMLSEESKIIGGGHVIADIGDETGDPDGKPVFRTSRAIQLQAVWMSWGLDHLIESGVNWSLVEQVLSSGALFEPERFPLIRRGVEAHMESDYVQSIHVLTPQLEAALLRLPPLSGKPSNKAFQTARGQMQFKNLNDLLAKDEWPISGAAGEDLRLCLLAVLAHPKGMNIRNELCHGHWPPKKFTKHMSERVIHALFAIALLQQQRPPDDPKNLEAGAGPPADSSPDERQNT
jgi:lysyl-tRNA synthetase class 1